jgi:hypothetical protein
MRRPEQSPSIVPSGDDQVVYLVLEDFGDWLGQAWRDTDVQDANLKTLIEHLLEGQYTTPFASSPSTQPKAGRAMSRKRRPRC